MNTEWIRRPHNKRNSIKIRGKCKQQRKAKGENKWRRTTRDLWVRLRGRVESREWIRWIQKFVEGDGLMGGGKIMVFERR